MNRTTYLAYARTFFSICRHPGTHTFLELILILCRVAGYSHAHIGIITYYRVELNFPEPSFGSRSNVLISRRVSVLFFRHFVNRQKHEEEVEEEEETAKKKI